MSFIDELLTGSDDEDNNNDNIIIDNNRLYSLLNDIEDRNQEQQEKEKEERKEQKEQKEDEDDINKLISSLELDDNDRLLFLDVKNKENSEIRHKIEEKNQIEDISHKQK